MASIIVLFDRKNKLLKSGKGTIEFQIITERKPVYIGSKLSVHPAHWDKRKARVNNKFALYIQYNDFLDKKISEIEKYFSNCVLEEKPVSIELVKGIIKGTKKEYNDFIAFAEAEIELRTDISYTTMKSHKYQIKKLKAIIPGEVLPWSELNYDKVQFIERKLFDQGLADNTRWKVHKVIKTYINIAIIKEFLKEDPYALFKVKKSATKKESITTTELNKLVDKIDFDNIDGHQVSLIKYVFSCYTGLRISDIDKIKAENFTISNDAIYMTLEQQKSKRFIRNFPILKVAKVLGNQEIIQLIFNKFYNEFENTFFPTQSDQLVNRQLKDWANAIGMKKNLSFHSSRHTFGTRLAEITGDVLLIKELMGHSKIETSMEYIHLTSKSIERKLDNYL